MFSKFASGVKWILGFLGRMGTFSWREELLLRKDLQVDVFWLCAQPVQVGEIPLIDGVLIWCLGQPGVNPDNKNVNDN